MTDKALIRAITRAQRGDARAFDTLVRRFQNTALAYARTLLPDAIAAEDAAQEAFVQAWRDLPSLTEAAAFAGWLRRIVFKFCDRVRRSTHLTLPLTDMLRLPDYQEPAAVIERRHTAACVRASIDALPDSLRETTLLYYLSGHDLKEIAAFLAVPPSTIKNRLHAARKRLRKELWTMAETTLHEEPPAQQERFAQTVLARVLREFQQQEAADRQTADRSLLDEGQTALFELLATDVPLDSPTVRDGFLLLWRKRAWPAQAGLLMRYLTQSLSDSEIAWAYLHLANAIAMSGSAAGAVLAHETFEQRLPGYTPRLSAHWPHFPVTEDASLDTYTGDEVRLLFLSQSAEFSTAYLGVWRNNDYLAKVDAALASVPMMPGNRLLRFYVLRMATNACESSDQFDRSASYIRQMHGLADGAEEAAIQANLHAKALGHEVNLARRRKDDPAFTARVGELTALLAATEQAGTNRAWVREERHDLACELVWAKRYDLALPLWEANAASGGHNGWGWLMHAATIWQVSQDRERTLALLREARAHDDRDMVPLFAACLEFASVKDDPAFRQAIGREEGAGP